ncbi:MAG: SCP2 sterol-binding domain-containing protein [Alphaproteobacteria bacterium]|jgi:putative sterol carrier protein
MSLEKVTAGLRETVGEDCGLGASVKWDFGDGTFLMLDASQVPNVISNEDVDADCTLKISMEDFIAMTEGELDGTSAFMSGRLKIEGDMGIAMKLQGALRG